MIKNTILPVALGTIIGLVISLFLIWIWGGIWNVVQTERHEEAAGPYTVQKGATESNGRYEEPSRNAGTDGNGTGQLQEGMGRGKDNSEGLGTAKQEAAGDAAYCDQEGIITGAIDRGSDDGRTYDFSKADTYVVSAYSLGPGETGKSPGDPDYGVTASGAVVQDKGGGVKGKHIDLYIADPAKVGPWGVPRLKVIILEMGDKS